MDLLDYAELYASDIDYELYVGLRFLCDVRGMANIFVLNIFKRNIIIIPFTNCDFHYFFLLI